MTGKMNKMLFMFLFSILKLAEGQQAQNSDQFTEPSSQTEDASNRIFGWPFMNSGTVTPCITTHYNNGGCTNQHTHTTTIALPIILTTTLYGSQNQQTYTQTVYSTVYNGNGGGGGSVQTIFVTPSCNYQGSQNTITKTEALSVSYFTITEPSYVTIQQPATHCVGQITSQAQYTSTVTVYNNGGSGGSGSVSTITEFVPVIVTHSKIRRKCRRTKTVTVTTVTTDDYQTIPPEYLRSRR